MGRLDARLDGNRGFHGSAQRLCAALVLAAIAAMSGGWHHYRYSDMDADDLALRLTETGQPVWVRGVVRDALGIRTSEGFGFGATGASRVSTRFVLDLTEISDGKEWRRASGRATTIVTGDRSDILAGQPVEAAGEIALVAPPTNPGEFDYRAFSASRRHSAAIHDRRCTEYLAPAGRSRVVAAGNAGSGSVLEPRPAFRAARSVSRPAGLRTAAGPARGN